MMSLEWQQVDLAVSCLTFNPTSTKGKRRKLVFLGGEGVGHLKRLARFGANGRVFEWRHDKAYRTRQLDKIATAAGIELSAEQKFHAVRRTVGNYVAEHFGIEWACEKLGHSNMQVTRLHYAQAARKAKSKAATMPVLKVVG